MPAPKAGCIAPRSTKATATSNTAPPWRSMASLSRNFVTEGAPRSLHNHFIRKPQLGMLRLFRSGVGQHPVTTLFAIGPVQTEGHEERPRTFVRAEPTVGR